MLSPKISHNRHKLKALHCQNFTKSDRKNIQMIFFYGTMLLDTAQLSIFVSAIIDVLRLLVIWNQTITYNFLTGEIILSGMLMLGGALSVSLALLTVITEIKERWWS